MLVLDQFIFSISFQYVKGSANRNMAILIFLNYMFFGNVPFFLLKIKKPRYTFFTIFVVVHRL